MEELFADAFGTMMLGPAYVHTMMWSFGSPSEPVMAVAIAPTKQGTYEEHPPGHIRVVVACRLLGLMGYGALGDRLEASWRRAHREPRFVYFPTRTGGWATVSDESVVARALNVAEALYEGDGVASLNGFPLRSIPGLDFGPREHEAALSIKDAMLAGRKPTLKDPRLVIAGAVLAWAEKPSEAARVLKVSRDLIQGVGVPKRRPQWAPESRETAAPLAPDAQLWRDAVILNAVMKPRGRVSSRR
jgi:hypothetical protein